MNKYLFILVVFFSTNGFSQYRDMIEVGIYKQQLYDKRKDWIQNEIYRLDKIVGKLFNDNTMPSGYNAEDFRKQLWDKFVDYINSIRGYDFADNYQFNIIKNSINSYENWFIENYNNIIRSQ